jgi:hypothetical protein
MKQRQTIRLVAALGAAVLLGGCDLDVVNPNSPTEEAVITDVNGVVALAVGMQGQFAQSVEDYVVTGALTTDEWGTRTRALLAWQSLFTGDNFENTYGVVAAPYTNTYAIAKSANTLLAASGNLGLSAGFETGINSLARLFKAMALGMSSMQYQNLPADIAAGGAVLLPRADVRDTVLALLEKARTDLDAVSDADLANFNSRVLGTGVNLRATVNAMLARYYLLDAQYQQAITAATRVPANVLSMLAYPAPTTNPIWGLAIDIQYVGGTYNFVQAAEAGDRRPGYWLVTTSAPIAGNPGDSLSYTLKKYATQNESFPLYLPDEMKLIQAEAQARLGSLPAARTLINQVRTQTSSAVDEPVAGLTALTDAQLPDLNTVLRQIGYERRYELYMQGLRWDDTRRLPVTSSVTFQYLPLPATECRDNPNARALCGLGQ